MQHVLIYSTLGADPDFEDLVAMYVGEMPERAVRLQSLFAAEAWEELRRLAHQIKGAAGSYGFDQITQPAGRLEMSIINARSEAEIERALDDLLAMCQALRAGAPADDCGAR